MPFGDISGVPVIAGKQLSLKRHRADITHIMHRIPEPACLYYHSVLWRWWCHSCWEDVPSIKGAEFSDRKQRRADPTHLGPCAASSPLWPPLHGAKPLPAWPWHPSTSAGLGYWLCQNLVFPGQDRGRRIFHLVRSLSMGTLFKTEHSKVTLASMDMCYTETLF